MSDRRRSAGRPKADPNSVPTRERILMAGEQAFGDSGFAGARLEDIAEVAGIRRPSLLHHFASKDALYRGVMERLFNDLRLALTTGLKTSENTFENAETQLLAYHDFMAQRAAFAPLLLRCFIDKTGPGRAIVIEHLLPTLGLAVEAIRGDEPIATLHQAVLLLACDGLLRSAAADLAPAIWQNAPSSAVLLGDLLQAD